MIQEAYKEKIERPAEGHSEPSVRAMVVRIPNNGQESTFINSLAGRLQLRQVISRELQRKAVDSPETRVWNFWIPQVSLWPKFEDQAWDFDWLIGSIKDQF